MRLYATTKSERASKGQGGNDYLEITITNEGKENIAQVNVYNDKVNHQYITTFVPLNCQESENGIAKAVKTRRYYTAYNSGKIQTKGKRQKGENCNGTGKHTNCEAIINCLVCKNDPLLN